MEERYPTSLGSTIYGSTTSGIAVDGTDVYVAGVQGGPANDVATYWKNGVAYPLTDGTREASVSAITISNGDVYVLGGEDGGFDSSGNPRPGIAEYWKNGSAVVLSPGFGGTAICVSGSNVYIAGSTDQTTETAPNSYYEAPVATLLTNGVPTYFTDNLHPSGAQSVFVSGSDVYVAGYTSQTAQEDSPVATYWKNGVAVTLPRSANSSTSNANSIFVSGQDVYVSGGDNLTTAEYWKDGTLVPSWAAMPTRLSYPAIASISPAITTQPLASAPMPLWLTPPHFHT